MNVYRISHFELFILFIHLQNNTIQYNKVAQLPLHRLYLSYMPYHSKVKPVLPIAETTPCERGIAPIQNRKEEKLKASDHSHNPSRALLCDEM